MLCKQSLMALRHSTGRAVHLKRGVEVYGGHETTSWPGIMDQGRGTRDQSNVYNRNYINERYDDNNTFWWPQLCEHTIMTPHNVIPQYFVFNPSHNIGIIVAYYMIVIQV